MSRVAKKPIPLPAGVDVAIDGQKLTIKGSKGTLTELIPEFVTVTKVDSTLQLAPTDKENADAIAGSWRALIQNMVTGVAKGFERKLTLVGVGYRAQAQGKKLNLTLGFSHPVEFMAPEGVTVETPSQTEIIIKGINKQVVGQAAANIRAFRPPEPYKGKGVRYSDEKIIMKEAKKK